MNVFKHYLLIVAISILPLISIFITSDLPHTHDGFVHLSRIAAYDKALKGGQILPRWASDLNYGYGMPLFNFIYHTPYLLSSLLITLGFTLVQSFKIVIFLSFILSGITMFAFAHEFFGDVKKAFLVTVFYQFAPFRLVEVLVRGSFGEMYTYVFLPLVLLGLTRLTKKQTIPNLLLTAVATGLLIISHNSISLVFFGVITVFLLFFVNKKNMIYAASALVIGLLLASFYWIPALLEHKYTLGDLYMKNIFREHFPPLVNFFIPNFFNTESLQTLGINVQIGLFHVFALFFGIHIFLTKKIDPTIKKVILFSLLLTGISIFFMQPISTIAWEKISLLRQFQFPWRLLSIITITTALSSVSFFSYSWFHKKNIYLAVTIGVILTTAVFWYPPLGFDKVTNEREYWDYPLTTTYWGETDVIWSAGPAKQYPKAQIEFIEGTGDITNVVKKSTAHTATIQSPTGGKLADNTQYFPGWRVYVNNQKTPIEFQNELWRGLITFPIPKGTSEIKIIFEKSKVQIIAEYISLSSVGIALFMGALSIRKKFI